MIQNFFDNIATSERLTYFEVCGVIQNHYLYRLDSLYFYLIPSTKERAAFLFGTSSIMRYGASTMHSSEYDDDHIQLWNRYALNLKHKNYEFFLLTHRQWKAAYKSLKFTPQPVEWLANGIILYDKNTITYIPDNIEVRCNCVGVLRPCLTV